MKPLDERSFAFYVKIWEERRDIVGADAVWRGSVDDVGGGDRLYFASLRELCAYLEHRSGMIGAPQAQQVESLILSERP